ncbi:hypothetical protein QE394_002349 [Arthrobacter sp. SORGH_AS 212]|nr:hypothetical protein [Arthrobacter sp. SORGH_AS_0212]
MAINSELTTPKPGRPEDDQDSIPAEAAAAPGGSTPDTAAPPAEDTLTEPLPDTEEYDQILEELRQTKTEHAVSQRRNRKLTLDKATFGITGAIAVAFVLWGFFGKDSLAATSKDALDWVMEYTGWLFMVLASLFVVFVLWLAMGKIRQHPPRQGRRKARIPYRVLDRHDVRGRHGHRPDVLRRRRTALPFHLTATRNG